MTLNPMISHGSEGAFIIPKGDNLYVTVYSNGSEDIKNILLYIYITLYNTFILLYKYNFKRCRLWKIIESNKQVVYIICTTRREETLTSL